ncbi:MAG: hypothetical protein H0Z35_12430 [Thermoanaerobacteraceae bacterium]|nr:hypothetical protein [Thermoanaerobacteraceae bacterium]
MKKIKFKLKFKLPKIRLPSRKTAQNIVQEAAFWAGLFMFGKGLYMIWPPLMWLIIGLGLIWVSLPTRTVVK